MSSLVLLAAGIVIGRMWGWLHCGAEAEAHKARREIRALRRAGEAEMAAIARNARNWSGVGPRHAAPKKQRGE